VAGRLRRSNYFEDERELGNALGLNAALSLSVDEFSDEQMRNFLSRFPNGSGNSTLPSWLPTRPLLLGYLASKGLLSGLAEQSSAPDAVDGWDYLLEQIYEREERIETNLDGSTLRQILERAATFARASEDGLGPISRSDLFTAFREVCGYEPDEQGVLAIQRLPGLGIYRAEDESRCFVDKELSEVCNGRELARFLEDPYGAVKNGSWVEVMNSCDRAIGDVGAEFAIRKLSSKPDARGALRQVVAFLSSRSDLACARGDVASVVVNGNLELDLPLAVQGVSFSGTGFEFHPDLADLHQVAFSHCMFDRILVEANVPTARLPHFDNCLFEHIVGRMSSADLPKEKFSETCDVATFDSSGTPGAIRETQLTTGEKVLLVTLRKLFVQSLSGRAEGALFRGLDVDERRCVPDILRLLSRHGLATGYSRGDGLVWLPARKAISRVKRILAAPAECGEPVVAEARTLK
jgi:hypothetical protein